jgi:hypothetical protein
MKHKVIISISLVSVTLIFAFALLITGLTPFASHSVIAEQGLSKIVQSRSIPVNRFFDLSFRMKYSIELLKNNGNKSALFATDDGLNSDIIDVSAIPNSTLYQLRIRKKSGEQMALIRFDFN